MSDFNDDDQQCLIPLFKSVKSQLAPQPTPHIYNQLMVIMDYFGGEQLAFCFNVDLQTLHNLMLCMNDDVPKIVLDEQPFLTFNYKIANVVILVLLFLCSIVGNLILIYHFRPFTLKSQLNRANKIPYMVLLIDKNLKNAIDLIFWFSAFVDLSFTSIVIPFQISLILNDNMWVFNDMTCKAYGYLNYFVFCFTSLNIIVIAFDRYFSILYNWNIKLRRFVCTNSRNNVSVNTYMWLLAITIVSILIALPYLIYTERAQVIIGTTCFNATENYMCLNKWTNRPTSENVFKIVFILIIYILPGFILFYTYCAISFYLYEKRTSVFLTLTQKRFSKRKSVIKILIFDFSFYIITWFPVSVWILVNCLNNLFDLFTINIKQEFFIFNILYLGQIANISLKSLLRIVSLRKSVNQTVNKLLMTFNSVRPTVNFLH